MVVINFNVIYFIDDDGNVNLYTAREERNIMTFVPNEEDDHIVEADMEIDEEVKNGEEDKGNGEEDEGNEDDQKEDDQKKIPKNNPPPKGVKVVPAIKMVSTPWLKKFF